jgi:hypothetical protein
VVHWPLMAMKTTDLACVYGRARAGTCGSSGGIIDWLPQACNDPVDRGSANARMLRHTFQRDDWQMPSSSVVAHQQFQGGSWFASGFGLRRGAWRFTWPAGAGLKARPSAGG